MEQEHTAHRHEGESLVLGLMISLTSCVAAGEFGVSWRKCCVDREAASHQYNFQTL